MASITIGSGGVNRTLKDIYIGSGGINMKQKEIYLGNGGVNRKIYTSTQIVILNNPFTNGGYNTLSTTAYPSVKKLEFTVLAKNPSSTGQSPSWIRVNNSSGNNISFHYVRRYDRDYGDWLANCYIHIAKTNEYIGKDTWYAVGTNLDLYGSIEISADRLTANIITNGKPQYVTTRAVSTIFANDFTITGVVGNTQNDSLSTKLTITY